MEKEELARLERLETRLKQIELQMPTVASLVEAVARVADHLAPPAANIVGSRYIADRLGCTTAWVGKMAFNGMIPRKLSSPELERDGSGSFTGNNSTNGWRPVLRTVALDRPIGMGRTTQPQDSNNVSESD